jgi:hypothetical protein
MSFHYYGLIASLPYLSNDFSLDRLPISRSALKSRLRGLSLEDREQLWVVINFHERLYSITSYDDKQVVRMIEEATQKVTHPEIKTLFQRDVNLLIIIAALRQRLAARGPVLPTGEVGEHIRYNWQQPDFSLAARFTWIPEVRELLAQGKVLEVERRIDQVRWQYAVELVQSDPFTLGAIAAYLGKWDILYRWSQVDEAEGQQRFDELVGEILQRA